MNAFRNGEIEVKDLMERYTFKLEKLAVAYGLDRNSLVSSVELRAWEDYRFEKLILELHKTLVASDDIEFNIRYEEVPGDWWEHFKQRWFPAWALKRWPVKVKKIKIASYLRRMCPHVNIPSGSRDHIAFLMKNPI